MSTEKTLDDLQTRILSGFRLLFLKTWEESRWERQLSQLSSEMERELVVWSSSSGPAPPPGNTPDDGLSEPRLFLEQIAAYPPNRLFLFKDFHPYLDDPRIVRRLRDLLPTLADEHKTLIFIGPENTIPLELQKDALPIDLPLPGFDDLRAELSTVLRDKTGGRLQPTPDQEGRLLTAVSGLTANEAHRALSLVLQDRETIDDNVLAALVAEKKSLLQGSRLLEFYALEEGMNDIGGLENLKMWLAGRSAAFKIEAREQGIPMPKGVFLLGVQGCGKSLTARATARLLGFPLVRLDVSQLLSSDRGASEQNMREVLMISETMAPVVLWLDEIEKGFAGSTDEGDYDATMSRLIGQFLIWMEEKTSPVFVVATANSITNLPPELLRRGRFDEMFFIDLPNQYERSQVLKLHLENQGWNPDDFDVPRLAERTNGYSGAELAQIVKAATIDSYVLGEDLNQKALDEAQDRTVPLSVTLEEKIFSLREWAKDRCRQATPDSRVAEMIDRDRRDERQRKHDEKAGVQDRWRQLADQKKFPESVCEYVGGRLPETSIAELQQIFAEFFETAGDQGLALRSDPNAVLWMGMSAEFSGLLSKLLRANRLFVHPATEDRYPQHSVKLPVVSQLPDDRLPRPGWLPVCVGIRPPKDVDSRLNRVARVKLTK